MVAQFLLFLICVFLIILGFLRWIFVHYKLWYYVKHEHSDFLKKNGSFIGGNAFSGWNIFDACEDLHDNKIEEYKKLQEKRLKQLLILVCAASLIGAGGIFFLST